MNLRLIFTGTLILLRISLAAQINTASVLLSAAIYEEEVAGNLNKANQLFLDLIQKFPDDRPVAAKALYHLGLVNEKMGKKKADEYFNRLINNYPDQKELVQLAKSRMERMGSQSDALMNAQKSFRLASGLVKQSRLESALAEYQNVIRLAPESVQAVESELWTGHCQYKLGKLKEAVATLNTLIREHPENVLIPAAELMISQVRQAIGNEPPMKNNPVITLDDSTIKDTITGIKYTRINSWAGKNDILLHASSITDISPKGRFLIHKNLVIPFDNSDPIEIHETQPSGYSYSRLSPDGSSIAFRTDSALFIIPVSPESGRPTGPANELIKGNDSSLKEFSWSPDGKSLVMTVYNENFESWLNIFNFKDSSFTKITQTFTTGMARNPVCSRNGSNFLYQWRNLSYDFIIKLSSATSGKSLTLVDSCLNYNHFILSPDNGWILYKNKAGIPNLFRLADKQKKELVPPEEVGDFVSWAGPGSKVYYYRNSYESDTVISVASINGGPVFECGGQPGQWLVDWLPDSKGLIVAGPGKTGQNSLRLVSLGNQESKLFAGLSNTGSFPSFSPDRSHLLLELGLAGRLTDLSSIAVSLRDGKVAGEAVLFFRGFTGYALDCAWSPDGKKIAVCNQGELYICYPEAGETPVQLTTTPYLENFPLWSPDGNLIAVFESATTLLRIIRANDGEVIRSFENVEYYDWIPPKTEIIIANHDGLLFSFELTTGKVRNISNWKELSNSPELWDLKCSPDGKWVAIEGYNNNIEFGTSIYLINVTDGTGTEIAGEDPGDKDRLIWSPDSRWIAYVSDRSKKVRLESTLWEADLTEFMNKMKPGDETGWTTDFEFEDPSAPSGPVGPDGTFTDTRDGHEYKYRSIGDQTWMAENMAYLPEIGPDSIRSTDQPRYYVYGFNGTDAGLAKSTGNYQKYGVLYNWPAAMKGTACQDSAGKPAQGICPAGWHLPGDNEWMKLEKTLGMNEADLQKMGRFTRTSGSVGKKLKSAEGWDDDDIFVGYSGLDAMPGGIVAITGNFGGIGKSSYFWSSTIQNNKITFRMIDSSTSGIMRNGSNRKDFALSVRCIKD